jgi:CheY-like chemotaxis protein
MNEFECEALRGRRVLVVDDDADTREMLVVTLESSGAVVATAETVAEALAMCEAAPPDVIISDIGLPGEDGFSLVRRLRAFPPERGGNVPAIALSGYDSDADKRMAAREGFRESLTKPVALDEVVAAVVRALPPLPAQR